MSDPSQTADTGGYPALLRSMSDEVLLQELRDTYQHLLAAGLEADADVVSEMARRVGAMTQNADYVRLIAEALCPGDGEHFQRGWPCSPCWDAARRVAAALPRSGMAG